MLQAEAPVSDRTALAADTTTRSARLERGKQTVQTVCSACHTLAPPPTQAPPLPMVAMSYRRGRTDSAAAAAIVAWVRAPSADRSILPPAVSQRFGLMPALPLDERTLEDAALYVLSLNRMGGMGRMGQGMPMMPGPGMPRAP
jgi:mono/diheme cytochrome c family protein